MGDNANRPIFELSRLLDYSDAAIIAELRRVAELVSEGPLTARLFNENSRVARTTVSRRFGTWANALKAAGLPDRIPDGAGNHTSRHMSDEQVLEALRDLAARLGKSTLTVNDVTQCLPFGNGTLIRRWGTSYAAFEAAGLVPSKPARRYLDEECFDNLLTVWTHYGRQPNLREMGLPPSLVPGSAYVRRFGTWMKALAAFVDRVNDDEQEVSPEPNSQIAEQPDQDQPSAQTPARSRESSRHIPLGLRFRVLHRDHFKCIACGDHPARNPNCVLHVDHLVPWSLGGDTREHNLRTLCSHCNIGRGNRFSP